MVVGFLVSILTPEANTSAAMNLKKCKSDKTYNLILILSILSVPFTYFYFFSFRRMARKSNTEYGIHSDRN